MSGPVAALSTPAFARAAEVRQWIVDETRLDLVGPGPGDTALHDEILPQAPSRWYLTGLLVPLDAPDEQRAGDAEAEGELDSGDDAGGGDDAGEPDHATARKVWRPSSLGLSFLLATKATEIEAEVIWGDYRRVSANAGDGEKDGGSGRGEWRRTHRVQKVTLSVSQDGRSEHPVPNSKGLELSLLVRPAKLASEQGVQSVKAVSIFVVNRRHAVDDAGRADEAFAFQVVLAVNSPDGFLSRCDLKGFDSKDWDERVADLHYRDIEDYSVGHNVAAEWVVAEGKCRRVVSSCMPLTSVPRVVPNLAIPDFELEMDALGKVASVADAKAKLGGVVSAYRLWLDEQRRAMASLSPQRADIAHALLDDAYAASNRIDAGIKCLEQDNALEAFRIANRAMARAARQREMQIRGTLSIEAPRWRPFQLAFILLNLRGIVEPLHADRETVDLLFFPTGGGKTEAYLGLAAFVIAYRRLTNPALSGAGLSVLMRYTLRLLTLDQLGRAAALICALELERQADTSSPKKLGDWPIEIGLWVGRGATPNRMGREADGDSRHVNARSKVLAYIKNTKNPLPIPIRTCPWCGTPFAADSFRLVDADGKVNQKQPFNLELRCVNRDCEFHLHRKPLPILTVDEPIYRRIPAFLIATVDKFAGMPWTGEIANFFGAADRSDGIGFFGPATPGAGTPLHKPLLPPDLIIQDELHLISGPLGTMVGLYEAALDRLCWRDVAGRRVRPKIVVSTATVRRAERQVRALFDRQDTRVFPPPGPDRRDSFFARTLSADDPGARRYLGIAVPGGSPKVMFLKTLITVMAIAETAWEQNKPDDKNPADPYMTMLAYFNALRELGGARRIVEGEVGPRLNLYDKRLRVGETARYRSRVIKYDVMELTSRVPTDQVAEAKRRLASAFKGRKDKDSVDVALATNMISVGLDITRLGLMVVSGQPKTAAEYIQATSRVGREAEKPGLVIALLNVNKPRDRSHYERFVPWHSAFYRSVEPTSVTPYSPRALDRALAAVSVGLARLAIPEFTPSSGARLAQPERGKLDLVADLLAVRAGAHDSTLSPAEQQELTERVRRHVKDILDSWARISSEVGHAGVELAYQKEQHVAQYLLREMLDRESLSPDRRKFRAPRSLRDVEPPVLIKLETPKGQAVLE